MKKFFVWLFVFGFSFGCTALLVAMFFYKLDDLPEYKERQPKEWMLKQIHSDLSDVHFQESYPEFDAYVEKHKIAIGKVTIHNGIISYKVSATNEAFVGSMGEANYKRFLLHIEKLRNLIIKGAKLPNVTFYLYSWDAPTWEASGKKLVDVLDELKEKPPIFVNAVDSKIQKKYNFILIPDDFVTANRKFGYWIGWNLLSKQILKYNQEIPWSEKENELLWRGKAASPDRKRTIELSENFPNYINSKDIYNPIDKPQILKSIYEIVALNLSVSNFMNKKEQIKFKMLLNLDGCTCTYPGFLWRLLSNSVTLKQDTDNIQWFYPALKPWVHYVPVEKDMGDLLEKVKWVLENEAAAKRIADESTKFVKENLMMEDIDNYIVTLLNEYARAQNSAISAIKAAKKTA